MKKFTMIELLVVIAIIGILVSILVPSISKAREKANIAVEISNRKQLTIATLLYATENNQKFPERGSGNGYLHALRYQSGPDLNVILLEKYMGDIDMLREPIFFCSSRLMEIRNTDSSSYTNNHTSGSYNLGTVNYYVIPPNGSLLVPGFKNSNTMETSPDNALWSCMSLKQSTGMYMGHDGLETSSWFIGASTSYTDGSAQFVRQGNFTELFRSPINQIYYHPDK
ncbi:MAG: prepilin-type N-terminal cleavage/methylation domain-containing protein [Lentisphaeraceae bacterium]|nr:prepilin-type N-terminal cleavage/methylation domain-containing protein [Lentisphaeraceae bacterium]